MTLSPGTTGLILNEPLLWEKGRSGRCGFSLPRRDVESFPLDDELVAADIDLPHLSEVDLVRHYTRLSQWNFGIDTGMYPLGSCTMKYNPKINEKQAGLSGFTGAHPLLPDRLSHGALGLMFELSGFLSIITGMDAVSLQPAAGAQGELSGMLMIWAYHQHKGGIRSKIIIPDTAHGTNPASAALCNFKPVPVKSNEQGILSPDTVSAIMDEDTAGIMVTNPNTLGLYEENLKEIADIVHGRGGLVYCDGANMNAVMGSVDIGRIGVDLLHLNLHKTFATPHGGGGPGAGPICVKKNLERFLPVPRIIEDNGNYSLSDDFPDSIGELHAFHGNFGVMIRACSYILSMGHDDLRKASQLAVLNANYIKESLKEVFHLPYDRACMHECVFSDKFQRIHNITTLDMAKRLMDYGFHPPTIYFPLVVSGAMMIEPTETESREDIDTFIEVCKTIAKEAEADPDLFQMAPRHTKVTRLDETAAARKPCLSG